MSAPRWVSKEAREYLHGLASGCPACGTARAGRVLCQAATCRACGSVVCLHSCGSRGQCPVCTYGLVEGWSHMGARCGYAGCVAALSPIAAAPRVGYVCRAHLDRSKLHVCGIDRVKRTLTLAAYVAEMLSTRPMRFVEVAP